VVERVGQTQALVEIGLRLLVRGGDLVGDGAEAIPQRRLGVREIRRGSGGAHLGAWHFSLCKTQHHHVRTAACAQCTTERDVGIGERQLCVGGSGPCISEGGDIACQQRRQCGACKRGGSGGNKERA
jgi:hypothetical protein